MADDESIGNPSPKSGDETMKKKKIRKRKRNKTKKRKAITEGSNGFSKSTSVRIAVVGDVHDDWNLEEDTKALQLLQPDLVLFVGDFGDANVKLVESIADLTFAKAVILGNHDAWTTSQFSSRKKDPVQRQLDCLGEEHVGYRRLDFPTLKLSVVGGRPFSSGGRKFFRPDIIKARYGVRDMEESAKRIYEAALGTPEDHSIIFLAHSGPTGLGSKYSDICGRDWVSRGGDHGDPDLAYALSQLKETAKLSVPLVVFGHMHKNLLVANGPRKMLVVGDDNTTYLNTAVVPRVKQLGKKTRGRKPITIEAQKGTRRAFTTIEVLDGRLEKIAETWVSVIGDKATLDREHVRFSSGPSVGPQMKKPAV